MRKFGLFLLSMMMLLVWGCDKDAPRHLSHGKMEAILYDYHVADAVSNTDVNYDDTLRLNVYKLAVLQKHGVTEADFDSSMVYYTRHADELYEIYERLSKRLADEALILGASASEANRYMTISNTGDTANIWTGDESLVLTQHAGFNVYSFSLKADTTYKPGDQFMLSFETKFIYQDGARSGMALLALTYENDSTASVMTRMSIDNQYRVNISDGERRGIKQVSGYFMLQHNPDKESRSTLKLMHVGNIALVRIHTKKDEMTQPEPQPETGPAIEERQLDPREPEPIDEPIQLDNIQH